MDDIIWLPHFPFSPTYFLDALNLFCHLMVTLVSKAFHLCNSCSPFFFQSHLNQMQKSISVNKLNKTFNTIYEDNLFVLFCLYLWDPPNRDVLDCVLGLVGKFLRRRGASAWFHDVWTCDAKVLEYWMISSLEIKLNRSWKFWKNWNVPLVLLERSWWAGFIGIYLVRFGFRMWQI
jgi:hypothetical protein